MLEKVILKNFRCYEHHTVEFKTQTIIVGKNNAGKSTLVDALRLISLASNKFKTSSYITAPEWTELPLIIKGIKPSLKNIDINQKNIFHRHDDSSPATIKAIFHGDIVISLYINNNFEIFCTLENKSENYIKSKSLANNIKFSGINILPQISQIEREEKILGKDYVVQNLFTNLSSRHFRNQLYLYEEHFNNFKKMSEESWSGLRIFDLEINRNEIKNEDNLNIIIQEHSYADEIGSLGSGIQMWLQIMWFLSRLNHHEVIILDEPDVYMHPDLQRKLIRLLKYKFKQVIVATHSVEIISEVEPDNILIIDKTKYESIYANKIPIVQGILNSIGSIHNLQLTKLWSSKKLLIVEGDDISLLKVFQNKLFLNSNEPFDTIPNFDIGGWGGWNYAKGSSLLIKETVDKNVKIYCIFDSDYHTKNQIENRKKEALDIKINIHIWNRKEIENYLINENAIFRIVQREGKKNLHKSTINDIKNIINMKLTEMTEELTDKIADELHSENKNWQISKARSEAKKMITNPFNQVSGKALISNLSKSLQDLFGISISPKKLVNELKYDEIDVEIKNVITSIEKQTDFM